MEATARRRSNGRLARVVTLDAVERETGRRGFIAAIDPAAGPHDAGPPAWTEARAIELFFEGNPDYERAEPTPRAPTATSVKTEG